MARILIYDLEVSPTLGWVYGQWQTNVLRVEKYPAIMSISWRWYGEKTTQHASLANIPRKRGTSSNEALVKLIHGLFDEADILIAHNANRFDNKVATGAFVKYSLAPPSPYKTVDTLQVARSTAKFGSNSLDNLGKELGLGRKSTITHASLWYDCLQGDAKAWKLMEEYNNQDVDLLYAIYEKLLPYIKNHPNLGDLSEANGVCPKCESRDLQRRGFNQRRAGKVQRYQCNNCGGWCNESNLKKEGRVVNA
jgi:DNA polymerase elongation subunit (family B)